MVSGTTSLAVVRDELFITMADAEKALESFISDRQNGSLLQDAIDYLQQVRGTLHLIELIGAELLAQELLEQTQSIPVGAGDEYNDQLSVLNDGLYVLRRYLENLGTFRQEMPELLLPTINVLRRAASRPLLLESFFFRTRLDHSRPAVSVRDLDDEKRRKILKLLRHVYQVGLLWFIRDRNTVSSLRMMMRAMDLLDRLYIDQPSGRLFWIAAAALESQIEGNLLPRKSRKLLFSQVEHELKQVYLDSRHEPPQPLLKELLYLVALANSQGRRAAQVQKVFELIPLPFTDHLLEEQYQRLTGPGREVIQSLSAAIQEELTAAKDSLDLIERGTVQKDALEALHTQLGRLSKILEMVGLSSVATALVNRLPTVTAWIEGATPDPMELLKLADSILHIEGMVALLDQDTDHQQYVHSGSEEDTDFARHQLNEARIVVVDEARAGLVLAKRAITAYLEAGRDKMHLINVPVALKAVKGGLWFLSQERIAGLVGICGEFIQNRMISSGEVLSEPSLETLADALASLEYYLESGCSRSEILDLATERLKMLDMPVTA